MSTINPNMLLNNSSNWQVSNSNKKTDKSNNLSDLSSLYQTDRFKGVTDFQSIMDMLSDPSKTAAFTSSTIEGRVEYSLKTAFQTEGGQNINLELNVKVDFKFEQATAAYSKNQKQQAEIDDYFSPEKTANRITDFAMAFLGAFQSNHADQTKNDALTGFFDLAKDAIAKGFDQAKNILGALYGEKAESTYDLVMKALDDKKTGMFGTDMSPLAMASNRKL
ncbi:MAG: hypothetical protein A2008_02145 [Candidatus Wallbacteria bacterium GWC2_49_35]|uniref:DUF5610 domain-containing protein n=1 Tax=Candidatus Wallbacteria bacterium GWC2_49_35 TaxID=1817813 RepID=A0A1F7WQJ1_9BACT|nr:MAG: hypothetical protein A2008_02145 [Candidatus Wallbacteria bacterium GWC2_49_35]HBC73972.1 hypothetical protein [Candidatus Wallbacteria bacterium]